MDDKITLERLLGLIHAGWKEFESTLERVGRERMEQPGVSGELSVKDVAAHVTWFEKDMLLLLSTRSMKEASPLWGLPPDERNRAIYEENRARTVEDVLGEARSVHAAMMAEIEKLSDDELHAPSRFEGMPPDWTPWEILCENTYEHYADHIHEIDRWLEKLRRGRNTP